MSIASEITRINNNIASAYSKVEEKGGTLPETQNSANLATAIDSISGGGGDYNVLINGNLYAPQPYIQGCITEIKNIDTSQRTSFKMFFYSCVNLTNIPQINTSNATNLEAMFSECTGLTSIPELDTSKAINMNNMFYRCTSLTTVPILDTANITSMFTAFGKCSNLSNQSLNNVLKMCINAVSMASNKTLRSIGLTSTQATTCQSLSNYQDFLDAGWTTGY